MSQSNLRMSIIVLTVITALVHLVLGVFQLTTGMMGGVMFLLNTAGFLGLMVLFFGWLPFSVPVLSGNKALQYWVYMGFAAVTIAAYFAVNGGASFGNPIGLFTKAVELLLIVALWLHRGKS